MKNKKINLEKGKQLYFDYKGSSCAIDRELGSQYADCNIPKQQELQWLAEIKEKLLCDIMSTVGADRMACIVDYMQIATVGDSIDMLADVIAIDQLDTFSRILLCEDLSRLQRQATVPQLLRIDSLIQQNIVILHSRPITIHPTYRQATGMQTYDFAEDNINQRIEQLSTAR